jgi:sialate O-acetylesterase
LIFALLVRNGMIYPLLNMRFAGAAWYQGEANSQYPVPYECQFPAMITDWRAKFGLELPFFFVQLAPFIPADGAVGQFPALRWAQQSALALDNTGMAVAADLGDPGSPYSSIHPRLKQEVGFRLMAQVLPVMYPDLPPVPFRYPSVASWELSPGDEPGVWMYTLGFNNVQQFRYALVW